MNIEFVEKNEDRWNMLKKSFIILYIAMYF